MICPNKWIFSSSVYSREVIIQPETRIKKWWITTLSNFRLLFINRVWKEQIEHFMHTKWYFTQRRRVFPPPYWATTSHWFISNTIYILVAAGVVGAHELIIDQQQTPKWIYVYIYWRIPFLLEITARCLINVDHSSSRDLYNWAKKGRIIDAFPSRRFFFRKRP